MVTDQSLLDSCPDFVSVGSMLKAHPQVEGGRRIIYFEASNEGLDQQSEVILSKALADAKDFFLKFGNIDIDHYTLLGAKLGIPDYPSYEIGQPLEVGQRNGSTFVKAQLYSGHGKAAEKANMVWSGMTEVNPPHRWYPSVGGSVLAKSIEVDPATQSRRAVVNRVQWTNVGLSRTPVNNHVGVADVVPVGVFAKALTAGYGTDSAALVGGGALRIQSLDTGIKSYWDFRERMAGDITANMIEGGNDAARLVAHASKVFGLTRGAASDYVERFLRDLKTGLGKGKSQ